MFGRRSTPNPIGRPGIWIEICNKSSSSIHNGSIGLEMYMVNLMKVLNVAVKFFETSLQLVVHPVTQGNSRYC